MNKKIDKVWLVLSEAVCSNGEEQMPAVMGMDVRRGRECQGLCDALEASRKIAPSFGEIYVFSDSDDAEWWIGDKVLASRVGSGPIRILAVVNYYGPSLVADYNVAAAMVKYGGKDVFSAVLCGDIGYLSTPSSACVVDSDRMNDGGSKPLPLCMNL